MCDAARRTLPEGYDDDASPFFIPRNLRTYYVTVSIPPARGTRDAYNLALDAACDWAMREVKGRDGAAGGDLP